MQAGAQRKEQGNDVTANVGNAVSPSDQEKNPADKLRKPLRRLDTLITEEEGKSDAEWNGTLIVCGKVEEGRLSLNKCEEILQLPWGSTLTGRKASNRDRDSTEAAMWRGKAKQEATTEWVLIL